jgi:hypothetical protein
MSTRMMSPLVAVSVGRLLIISAMPMRPLDGQNPQLWMLEAVPLTA